MVHSVDLLEQEIVNGRWHQLSHMPICTSPQTHNHARNYITFTLLYCQNSEGDYFFFVNDCFKTFLYHCYCSVMCCFSGFF